jgi:hypothetical protein
MDLSLLRDLEMRLHEAKQFSAVWDFFLTHFGEDPAFIALGQRGSDEFLDAVLRQVGQQLFGRRVSLIDPMLTRLPEYGFIHGTVLLEGRLTSALYFENIHKGMLAILAGPGDPPETKFVRFTGRALYGALNRSEN